MRRDAILLAEIISAIERILEITSGSSAADVEGTADRRDALLWNFTVLGEAVSQLSPELKAAHPSVPWSDASRTRNRIVHGYWSADVELLLAIARDDLPLFLDGVKVILASPGDDWSGGET